MLYGFWSSLQPDHETNKSPRRMQVSPPAGNDDKSPISKQKHLKTSDIFSLPRISTKDFPYIKGKLTDRLESTTALSILNGPKSFYVASRLTVEVNEFFENTGHTG